MQTWSGGSTHITMPNFLETALSKADILRFFKFSKWPPAILYFCNRKILLSIWVERVETHQHAKFRQNRSIGCTDIKIFQFLRWRLPPSLIVEFAKFYWLTVSGRRSLYHISSKSVIPLRRYCDFSNFQNDHCRHLDYWNREILLVIWIHTFETHLHTKFCQNRLLSCEDIKILCFFKMAAVRHLGLAWGIFGPPTVSTCGSLSLCKIWLWSIC